MVPILIICRYSKHIIWIPFEWRELNKIWSILVIFGHFDMVCTKHLLYSFFKHRNNSLKILFIMLRLNLFSCSINFWNNCYLMKLVNHQYLILNISNICCYREWLIILLFTILLYWSSVHIFLFSSYSLIFISLNRIIFLIIKLLLILICLT